MIKVINGIDLYKIVSIGAKMLASDYERINTLNVFPVPDGDTGTNMKMTIFGGVNILETKQIEDISEASKQLARGMVLNARGNSGVILSQFFKGLSIGLENLKNANIIEFATAMKRGSDKSYSVVANPVEGTVLTVAREAVYNAFEIIDDKTSFEEYFSYLIKEAKISLENTPNLLPILRKAKVVDSGGAGFLLILEGMKKGLLNEDINVKIEESKNKDNVISSFNSTSELTYGYCTEFILQLQVSKVDIDKFETDTIVKYLESIGGNSIVAFKDEDIVKIHVHLFDPGLALSYCRKFGEFLTVKIENMNVQHSENEDFFEGMDLDEIIEKDIATVCVSNGEGLNNTFKELGVDVVVSGGQTMNTSTKDFIDAFEKIKAKDIFVFPNNGNILMSAIMASRTYDKANVHVIPTKSFVECISALSMFDFQSTNIGELEQTLLDVIKNVQTMEITYSIRDTEIDNLTIKKGDCISIYDGNIISNNNNRIELLKETLSHLDNYSMLTIIYGKDVDEDEINSITSYIESLDKEYYLIDGKQDVYSYIIGLE